VLEAALGDAGVATGADNTTPVAAAAVLLAAYWRVAVLECDGEDRAALAVILAAVFPGGDAAAAIGRAFSA